MGYFPVEDPQIAILITLDEPQRDKWGGVAAAPVFKKIGEQIVTCFKTNIRENPFTVPLEDPLYKNPNIKLVSTPAIISRQSDMDTSDEPFMPDFRGMTIREVLKKANEKDIDIKVVGNGWAVSQEPKPGTSLKGNRSCTVSFSSGY
jgi:cell division protein FtsI (penicillin-binding protein 3)